MRFLRRWRVWVSILVGSFMIFAIGRYVVMVAGGVYHGMRAPYLQMNAPEAITLRWQTAVADIGVVHYGPAPGHWQGRVEEPLPREAHEVRLVGLTPATRYYYAVGSAQQHHYGGDPEHFFVTAPSTAAVVPVRMLVLGDPGEASVGQSKVREAVDQWLGHTAPIGIHRLDMILVTGDLAYRSGSNPQFQDNFFTPYQSWLRRYPIWPTYGNHDARRFAYFKIFSLPDQAQSGGVASGTEHYYSFDYGPVHVVVLDSQASRLSKNSGMYRWLEQDLQATQQPWRIAMFHHPPYSKGTHDSDSWRDSWGRMEAMREVFLPVLERYGFDLVLAGHSHMYERSHLLRCHYGVSTTLQPHMVERPQPDGSYHKIPGRAHGGTLYAVVGSSAKLDHGRLDHPAMAVSLQERGALVIDITDTRLQGTMINEDGKVSDVFSLRHVFRHEQTPGLDCATP